MIEIRISDVALEASIKEKLAGLNSEGFRRTLRVRIDEGLEALVEKDLDDLRDVGRPGCVTLNDAVSMLIDTVVAQEIINEVKTWI